MKRYIKSAAVRPLKQEADRVFEALQSHPEVLDMKYEDETDAYCISFDNDAEDVGWIWDAMDQLGYKSTSQDEDAIYWGKGRDPYKNPEYRAWMYEDPVLELYVTN